MSTYVLIHGAWHGAWCWTRVRDLLTADGHKVVTPQLPSDVPGAGREEYLAVVREALDPLDDAVVVAHSMAGLVAPWLLDHRAIGSLVLLAALVPAPGTALLADGQDPYAEPMRAAVSRLRFDADARSSWDPADAAELFYHDSTADDAREAVASLRPDSTAVYGQPCPPLPQRRVPTTYVSCLQDRAIDGAWNAERAATLLDARTRHLPTGHSPFWSAPKELTSLLTELDTDPERDTNHE